MHPLKSIFFFIFCTISFTTYAQQSTMAAGGDATGSGGSASFSVGQIVYTTLTGPTGSMAQGVQQPYEISVLLGDVDLPGISLNMNAYPNPTVDFLYLEIDNYRNDALYYQLIDINGKVLQSKKIIESSTSVSMENMLPSTYFLKVQHADKTIKTFRIVKAQ